MTLTRLIPADEYRYVHGYTLDYNVRRDYPPYVLWDGEVPYVEDMEAQLDDRIKEYEERYGISSKELFNLTDLSSLKEDNMFRFEISHWLDIIKKRMFS